MCLPLGPIARTTLLRLASGPSDALQLHRARAVTGLREVAEGPGLSQDGTLIVSKTFLFATAWDHLVLAQVYARMVGAQIVS